MRQDRPRWPNPASLPVLALLGWALSASAVTLDREGVPVPPTLCPAVTVTKAVADKPKGGNRAYEFTGNCSVPPLPFVPVAVTAQASSTLTGTGFRTATEKITVTGPGVDGTIFTKAEKCKEDPFIKGPQVCEGPRSISTTLPAIWSQEAPLLAGRVPADQVFVVSNSQAPPAPAPVGLAGQVKLVTPTAGQVFSTLGGGNVLVEFTEAWPPEPPKGSVKLEWQRRSPRDGWVAHSVVSHVESYKQAQGFPIATYFKQPAKYRLRATSKTPGWTEWREFAVASAAELLQEIQSLAQRLQRFPRDPDAVRLLGEVRTLETRLKSQPGDANDVLPRVNELNLQVRQIEVVPRRLTPPRRSGAGAPAVKPSS